MKSPATDLLFWQEWLFWLTVLLGPLCWLVIFQLGIPLRDSFPSWKILLLGALLYPIMEEYVFRGGIQTALFRRPGMRQSVLGVSIANVLTSVVFAAMHLVSQPPLWAALIFLPSLIFGWMRDRYANIHASIVLHCIYNAGFIMLYGG